MKAIVRYKPGLESISAGDISEIEIRDDIPKFAPQPDFGQGAIWTF